MNAYALTTMWTRERVRELERVAGQAERAYTKDPMATACAEYGRALRAAAHLLDEHATAFEERSRRMASWRQGTGDP